jgi:hypothetical protein
MRSSGLTCLNVGATEPTDNWGTTLDFWFCDLRVSTTLEPLEWAASGPLSLPSRASSGPASSETLVSRRVQGAEERFPGLDA